MDNLSKGQVDLLFTLACAAAFDTDPWEMEEILKEEGLIDQPSTL